jgi:hypothetical protein
MRKIIILVIGFLILFLLAILFLPFLTPQAKAADTQSPEIDEYRISFSFQANTKVCIIRTKDAFGESLGKSKLSSAPILINTILFLPVRDFTDLMGGTTSWDAKERKVTLSFQGGIMRFELWLGKNQAKITDKDGSRYIYSNSAIVKIKNGRIMLSLRFIIEQFVPCSVEWSDELKMVTIAWPLSI